MKVRLDAENAILTNEATAKVQGTSLSGQLNLKEFDVDGYVTEDEKEFIQNLGRALIEDSYDRIQKRKEVARQNTWSGKVDKQLGFIQSKFN